MASWKKGDLTQLAGAPGAQGRPFAYVTHEGSTPVPRVVYRGGDDHIHELRLQGGSWKQADLMEQAGGAPGAASHPFAYETSVSHDAVPRVIYCAQGNAIVELRLDGGAWKGADLTDLAGAPGAQGTPSACVSDPGRHEVARVVYRAGDGHIHEVRLEGGSWKSADLSEQAAAPPASGDPFVYVSGGTVRVVYLGPDAHIFELHLDGNGPWKPADLSLRTEAPAAASDPFAYVSDDIPRVVYRGADAHVHELRLEGGSWKKGDLTALAGAEDAAGRPAAYVSRDGSRSIPRVLYRGGEGQIVELRLEGGSWKNGTLTDLAGAPPAAGDPVGYLTPDGSGSTPRVVYRTGDGHIEELRLE